MDLILYTLFGLVVGAVSTYYILSNKIEILSNQLNRYTESIESKNSEIRELKDILTTLESQMSTQDIEMSKCQKDDIDTKLEKKKLKNI